MRVHGITAETVSDAPTWDCIFPAVANFIEDDHLLAHNSQFDRSVLQQTSSAVDVEWLPNIWRDTMQLSRLLLTLSSYSLPFVSSHLGLPDFDHHSALNDATQCAKIAVELVRRHETDPDLTRWCSGLAPLNTDTRQERSLDFSSLDADRALKGEHVVFTGELEMKTRREALALVTRLGGTGQNDVTKKTTMVVTGDFDQRTLRPGAKLSNKLLKAKKLAEEGQRIEILTEADFLTRIAINREALESAVRAQRVSARGDWLPDYVLTQAQAAASSATLGYNQRIRSALAHPDGRADPQDPCVRCGEAIEATFWLYTERHVCSAECADALKRAAKRRWKSAGLLLRLHDAATGGTKG